MPASAAAAAGLAFALSLTSGGRSITSDHFTFRVPGAGGTFALLVEDPNLYGGTWASPVKLRNELAGDLLAASVEIVSVTETRAGGDGKESSAEHPAGEGRTPSWDVVKKGEDSGAQLLRAPVGAGDDLRLAILMGRAHGVVAFGGFELEAAPHPEALTLDGRGTLWVRDASGVIVRTDERGSYPVVEKRMPPPRETKSAACEAIAATRPICREGDDGTLFTAKDREVTARDPDGKSRSFPAGGEGAVTAIALGREGRLLVAAAGESGRRGSVRVFRPF